MSVSNEITAIFLFMIVPICPFESGYLSPTRSTSASCEVSGFRNQPIQNEKQRYSAATSESTTAFRVGELVAFSARAAGLIVPDEAGGPVGRVDRLKIPPDLGCDARSRSRVGGRLNRICLMRRFGRRGGALQND
jgi:hypothetical protein